MRDVAGFVSHITPATNRLTQSVADRPYNSSTASFLVHQPCQGTNPVPLIQTPPSRWRPPLGPRYARQTYHPSFSFLISRWMIHKPCIYRMPRSAFPAAKARAEMLRFTVRPDRWKATDQRTLPQLPLCQPAKKRNIRKRNPPQDGSLKLWVHFCDPLAH